MYSIYKSRVPKKALYIYTLCTLYMYTIYDTMYTITRQECHGRRWEKFFFFSTHYKILNARRGRKIREHNASQEGLESTDIRPNLF